MNRVRRNRATCIEVCHRQPRPRAYRFFDVAGFDDALDPVGIPGPNAGEKICLQLEPDGELIVLGFTDPTAQCLHTIGNAEQILHVVSDFVSDNVSLCEISACTEALLQQTVKTEVDVNASTFRAIERTARATGRIRSRTESRR
jgi:hypothetical protein